MAGKKPAKPIAGQSKQKVEDPAIYGTLTMFVGSKTARCACDKCGRETVRGMIRVLGESRYCSKNCVTSVTMKKVEA
jgi:hypothetical protein